MPKHVDHDTRRARIAEALLSLTAREGLEAVSLRHVAAEAGLSMGAVQHYFHTKDDMLVFALEHQSAERERRITDLVRSAHAPTVRSVLRTCLTEVLPTTEQSRSEWLVSVAFFIRALSEPAVAAVLAEGAPKVIGFFTELLCRDRDAGVLRPGADPHEESVVLWSLVDSQCAAIITGERTADAALSTMDYYLDGLYIGESVPMS
ncbi:TetR family transcriptional regulator [Amycolatopsis antarctica]|uniref:TetR family transcriptional regulator n=1 Tax=Amycolatopsis antarctica TaxID=1854586 RepID=A0A263DA16_9PSEU|nr:TetR/AcrR family transcriptional regulator [Amycolatopsis antarctica]OZM74377.1 TetR family transcriptional regulator [Amycolatopsis antarctica]